ncbi:hypothetical protein K469DRAFT_787688 [Zopfia rhizophila CBS 207.26]|uniref:Uncharacterized protein n=1 Tax=Zopfia rhizophila CBS 207.26 TaxID=1314779 RepID=A0A6A6DY47_9PEZI|nr:hypothetical protein K469DRAFT_787688 [Zopfia rhizophila CBS 207.26]
MSLIFASCISKHELSPRARVKHLVAEMDKHAAVLRSNITDAEILTEIRLENLNSAKGIAGRMPKLVQKAKDAVTTLVQDYPTLLAIQSAVSTYVPMARLWDRVKMMSRVQAELNISRQQLADTKNMLASTEMKLSYMHGDLHYSRETSDDLRKQLIDLHKKINDMKAESHTSRQAFDSLNKRLTDARKMTSDMLHELLSLRQNDGTLRQYLHDAYSRMSYMNNGYINLQQTYNKVRKQLEEANKKMEVTQTELGHSHKDSNYLHKRLEECQKKTSVIQAHTKTESLTPDQAHESECSADLHVQLAAMKKEVMKLQVDLQIARSTPTGSQKPSSEESDGNGRVKMLQKEIQVLKKELNKDKADLNLLAAKNKLNECTGGQNCRCQGHLELSLAWAKSMYKELEEDWNEAFVSEKRALEKVKELETLISAMKLDTLDQVDQNSSEAEGLEDGKEIEDGDNVEEREEKDEDEVVFILESEAAEARAARLPVKNHEAVPGDDFVVPARPADPIGSPVQTGAKAKGSEDHARYLRKTFLRALGCA